MKMKKNKSVEKVQGKWNLGWNIARREWMDVKQPNLQTKCLQVLQLQIQEINQFVLCKEQRPQWTAKVLMKYTAYQ